MLIFIFLCPICMDGTCFLLEAYLQCLRGTVAFRLFCLNSSIGGRRWLETKPEKKKREKEGKKSSSQWHIV